MYNDKMVCFKTTKKKGNITIILIGLISVMILMSFALSRRMSGHSQLLTLSDYTQISRYFLESYAGDVLRQINTESNKVDSQVFKSFREKAENGTFDSSFYSPSPMLTDLAKELDISFTHSPSIRFLGVEPLTYPKSIYCPPLLKDKEKVGTIELLCKATFRKKEYTLRVQYPFKVVLRMTPVIKDFALFVDQISKEQGTKKIGSDDHLNIMFTKNGVHPDTIDSKVWSLAEGIKVMPGIKYRPFMLLPPPDESERSKPELCGKVYLGNSKDMVYLNLAGDTTESGNKSVSELFLISKSSFKVATDNTDFMPVGVFPKKDGTNATMKGMDIKLKYNHSAKMGILGFSYEALPNIGTFFSGSRYTPADFFNTGAKASEFCQQLENRHEGYMAFASGLKLMGLDYPGSGMGMCARKIYGNVLARFFILTFWYPPQYGDALKYDATLSGSNLPSTSNYAGTTYTFKPLPGQTYQDFMSRMVSGYRISPTTTLPDGFMAYNSTQNSEKKIFTYKEGNFHSSDGFKAIRPFDELGRDWFGKDTPDKGQTSITTEKTGIEQRITRAYESGKAFLKDAQSNGRFDVNGVVYVKGALNMPELTMTSDKIGGGIILVDGPIKLRNITRGHTIDTDNSQFDYPALYQKIKTEITQDNFLTFVSLSGDPITIEEETLLGVHLINLNKSYTTPYDQIKWTNQARKEILFCGGIACNFLNLSKRLEEFGKVRNPNTIIGAPYFLYHSAMAAENPSMAAQMMENMRGYKLTSKSVSK